MRISDGDNPLDGTSVHPESYAAAQELMKMLGLNPEDIKGGVMGLSLLAKDRKGISGKLGVGDLTLDDIIKELENAETGAPHGCSRDERFDRRHDFEGNRAECNRLWGFCGYWGSPGRACTYIEAHK